MGRGNLSGWTREQLLVAVGLYCTMEFGKFHQRNPRIIEAAEKIGRTPSALAMKLSNFASLDPVFRESGRRGLEGASSADRAIWQELMQAPNEIMPAVEQTLADFKLTDAPPADEPTEAITPDGDYTADNRLSLTQQRRGQHIFRKAVLSSYEHRCCLTGFADPRFLVASHIRPWREDRQNRLNPRNGLCLSSLYDRAFDIGLITFSEDYRLLISPELEAQADDEYVVESFLRRAGQEIRMPSKFMPDEGFLGWHRSELFKSSYVY